MDEQLTLILIVVGALWGCLVLTLISCVCWRAEERRREHAQRNARSNMRGPYAAVSPTAHAL